MNTISKTLRSINLVKISIHGIGMGGLLTLFSCAMCGDPVPPDPFIAIATHYKNAEGADLLNPATQDAFRKEDLKVMSIVEVGGVAKEKYFGTDQSGIDISTDSEGSRFIVLIPTLVSGNPIATYVTLSPADTDTITYTFKGTRFKDLPDKIYYNHKLVWKIEDTPDGSNWNPITVIK